MLKVTTVAVGPLEANCHLVIDPGRNRGVIIDPGADREAILAAAAASGAVFEAVIGTHAHFDHVGANGVRDDLGARFLIHPRGAPLLAQAAEQQQLILGFAPAESPVPPDGFLEEGDEVTVGSEKLLVMHTPGHSGCGICLAGTGLVFTGDTLFRRGVGRTDLGGGSEAELKESLRRLFLLPAETLVYPGHGPATDIGAEKEALAFFLAA